MQEWKLVSDVNPDGHISMCLDRLHLSNFGFENREFEFFCRLTKKYKMYR